MLINDNFLFIFYILYKIKQKGRYFGTAIIIANGITEKSYEQELADDLISIIHYSSMKSYSHRRKLNKIRKELDDANIKDTNKNKQSI